MTWLPSNLLPTVTEPTTILVAEPGWYHSAGADEPPVLIGLFQAFPDGRLESEFTGMPPHVPTWYWMFERDLLLGVPTLRG